MAKREDYSGRRKEAAETTRKASRDGREVGPLLKVANWARRNRCGKSLLLFNETYFPDTFTLAWSDDHRAAIADAERVVRDGGQFALAMPRGSGKTSIAVRAALWAILYGFRLFVVLIAAEQGLADALIAVLRSELQFNDRLAADFPEVCQLIRALENITKRQAGQTLDEVNTLIKLTSDEIVFPTVTARSVNSPKQLAASGAVVRAVGLTGSVRGQIATTAGGRTVRPDLVLIDDAQTRESAKSPTQTAYREALVNGDVLGLAGPGVKIACMNLCTVIYPNDLSDRFLDRDKNPSWNGRRTRLMKAMPSDLQAWDEYAEERRRSLRLHGDNRLGNALYEANRERLDKGAQPAWLARHNPDELSATQHAMNIRIDRPAAFAAEFQNDPLADELGEVNELTLVALGEKLTRTPRGTVPRECGRLTAFVDVGAKVLWWMVCGWDEKFGGAVVDYGAWPRQNRTFFAANDARPSLSDAYPGLAEEAMIYRGLTDLTDLLLGKEWPQAETGTALRVDRCLVDSGWQTDTVYQFCRRSRHAALLLPSKGFGVSSTATPIDSWPMKPGQRRGPQWRLSPPSGSSGRLLNFDSNHWKSFVADRLLTPWAGHGCLGVCGSESHVHEMLFDHLTSEWRERMIARGREFDVWSVRADRSDNHLLDCLSGCAVAASERGLVWSADGTAAAPARPKAGGDGKKFSEMQREKLAKRNQGA